MVKEGFGVIEALFGGDRAEAKAADVLDAAAVDEVRDDVEAFVEVGAVLGFEIRNRAEELAQVRDFAAEAFEPLLGAEVEIQATAGVKLSGDFLEAVFFGGDEGGLGGGRCGSGGRSSLLLGLFFFLAAVESEEGGTT